MLRIETTATDAMITIEHRPVGRLSQVLTAVLLVMLSLPARIHAADLKPQTLEAWQAYLQAAKARNQKQLAEGSSFLSTDAPVSAAKLRQGEIIVSPAKPNVPIKVPSGLIHDWAGAIFIPNASIADVMRVIRDYDHYQTVYHPNVVGSKSIEAGEMEDRFSMVIMNKSFFAKSALDSDYHSAFVRVGDEHWYSTTETTRVQEVAEYEAASQHLLPEDHGKGIIWRLYSVARYEQRDGGVYIELEAIALSRDVPATLRFMVDPIVRRVSRSSLSTSLQQTAEAVQALSTTTTRSYDNSRQDRGAVTTVKPGLNTAITRSLR